MVSVEMLSEFYSKYDLKQQMEFTPLHTRQPITNYLLNCKKQYQGYKVIDVGSGADFWTKPFADATVDFYMTPEGSPNHFKVNLERESSWKKLLDFVEENGRFDFCVCSHTIEDLYYPFLALENFSKIAKQGIVIIPSIHREMNKGDRGQPSKGYDHHRFVYHPSEDGKVVVIPKVGHMEYKKYPIDTSGNQNELQILWNEGIDFIDFMQFIDIWNGSPKHAAVPITKGIGNISSVIFEAYCAIDPNKPLVY